MKLYTHKKYGLFIAFENVYYVAIYRPEVNYSIYLFNAPMQPGKVNPVKEITLFGP